MTLQELIGQNAIKNQVEMQVKYCKDTNSVFPHTLLIASAGQGKTTFANAIAGMLVDKCIQAYGPTIQTEQDLNKLFVDSNGEMIADGSVLFIDEIHAIPAKVAENLYTIMENFKLIKDGMAYAFPKFTLLAGTTEPQMMSKPLRDRFVNTFVFEPYTDKDVAKYVERDGRVWMDTNLYPSFGKLCKYTPRIMNSMLEKMRMFAYNKDHMFFSKEDWPEFLQSIGLTNDGLTALEDKYMVVLKQRGKASLSTLANLLGVKPNMVSCIIEPSLLAAGLIELAVGGRKLTELGSELYYNR